MSLDFHSKIIQFLTLSAVLIISRDAMSQNVGFGTNTPQYIVDVAGRLRLKTAEFDYPAWRLFGPSNQLRAHIGPINENYLGIYGYGFGGNILSSNVVNGNIGIGTISPAFKMDIVGRMRIQQDTSSAGIWFDGMTSTLRSLVGTFDNDHVGFYGNGGAGWGFVLNVNNGNIGIGTTSPTRKLDVNGSVRFRSTNPAKGNILTSGDTEGNAYWAKPEAYKAEGTYNGVPFLIDNQIWTKVNFNQSPDYNIGTGYQAAASEYIVPVDGIYHFKSTVTFVERADKHSIRIMRNRNGVITTIGEISHEGYLRYDENGTNITDMEFDTPGVISVIHQFLIGDIIWVEAFIDIENNGGSNTTILEVPSKTWFFGKLLARM